MFDVRVKSWWCLWLVFAGIVAFAAFDDDDCCPHNAPAQASVAAPAGAPPAHDAPHHLYDAPDAQAAASGDICRDSSCDAPADECCFGECDFCGCCVHVIADVPVVLLIQRATTPVADFVPTPRVHYGDYASRLFRPPIVPGTLA